MTFEPLYRLRPQDAHDSTSGYKWSELKIIIPYIPRALEFGFFFEDHVSSGI